MENLKIQGLEQTLIQEGGGLEVGLMQIGDKENLLRDFHYRLSANYDLGAKGLPLTKTDGQDYLDPCAEN